MEEVIADILVAVAAAVDFFLAFFPLSFVHDLQLDKKRKALLMILFSTGIL